MNTIKNLHLLNDFSEKDLALMEQAAVMHKRFSSIFFKILEVTPDKVVFRVHQEKSAAENYQNGKRLAEIVHETFDRFFPDRKIQVRPYPYKPAPPEQVDHKWVAKKMSATGINLKQIADETGLNYANLSKITSSGTEDISPVMKALFYYYFAAKELWAKHSGALKND